REYLGDDGGGAGAGGDQAHPAGAGATQVLVRLVEDGLAVGQVVHGGDAAVTDAEALVNDLDDRRQAIGGAAGGGDDAVPGRVEQVVVHAHHHVQRARLLHRRGHHHAPDALVQVGLQQGAGFHLAAGLDDQVAAGPVGPGDALVAGDRDALSGDDDGIALGRGLVRPAAMHGVEVEQVGEGGGVAGRVVDVREAQVGPVESGAQRQAADAAESVDAYLQDHGAV